MMTLILRPATDRLGLRGQEARGYRIFGMGGEAKAESVLIDDFRLGQASRKGWRMLVAGEHEVAEGAAVLLGEDFFLRSMLNSIWPTTPCDCSSRKIATASR